MRRIAATTLLAFTLVLAQCGGDDGDSVPEDTAAGDAVAGDAAGEDAGVPDDGGGPPPDTVTPPDVADVAPLDVRDVAPPDADAQPPVDVPSDVPPDAPDVPPTACETDADCASLVPPGDLCNVATCDTEAGLCDVGPKDCRERPEDDACTIDVCNPQTGACEHQPNPECFRCEPPGGIDNDNCDDRNPCTENRCNAEGTACEWVPRTIGCDDGNPCTEGERCGEDPSGTQVAFCGGGDARSCDDADDATLDWCDPLSEAGCRYLEVDPTLPCGDGVTCPQLPGFPCVRYECNEDAGRCEVEYTTATCSDNDPCTDGDQCADGVCVGGPLRDCDDGNPLTVDSCVAAFGGCVHAEQPGQPCATASDCLGGGADENACLDVFCREGWCVTVGIQGTCEDGLFCTTGDYCEAGQCVGGVVRDCDDGDPTSTCACDEEQKDCVCTPSLACGTGCTTGSDCNDGDPCTTDSCLTYVNPTVCICTPREFCECDHTAADGGASACDNGDAATEGICCAGPGDPHPECEFEDVCVQVFDPTACDEPCAGVDDDGACDDGSKCTLDTCEAIYVDPDSGDETFCCLHPRLGPPTCLECEGDEDCFDGDPCTEDSCGADGTCDPPGPPVLCECVSDDDCVEDDNLCTTVYCSDERTCELRNNSSACDDGDGCTWNDVCIEGDCVGEDRVCDDGDPCTEDTCDPVEGCVYVPLDPLPEGCDDCRVFIERDPDYCADGNPCTADICGEDGACRYEDLNANADTPRCQPFACNDQAECDDGNPCTVDQCAPPEPDPDPGDDITPSAACLYFEDPLCTPPAPLADCVDPSDCEPTACVPDGPRAFCLNPREACPEAYCDGLLGCRFLPTASCVTVECTPETQHIDCYDQNPCTADICDPDTLSCGPPDAERPSLVPEDNLYGGCTACETAADCPETGAFDATDPCITVTCRAPEITSPADDPPTGFCYAHIDQELFPNGCEDYDLCTIDTCVPGVGCANEPRSEDCHYCGSQADCDDFDPCTQDECAPGGFSCTHEPIPDCVPCVNSSDCPGGEEGLCGGVFCDLGRCTTLDFGDDPFVGPVCVLDAGCTTNEDCAAPPGTLGVCTSGPGHCLLMPDTVGQPCETSDECFKLDPCVAQRCVEGTCTDVPLPDCTPTACATQEDCEDDTNCTLDVCAGGFCVNIAEDQSDCCETAADCVGFLEDAWPCGTLACNPDRGLCVVTTYRDVARCVGGCETDADCTRTCEEFTDPDTGEVTDTFCTSFCVGDEANRECYDWPCAEGRCSATGDCIWFDGDCTACEGDGDCVDPDPCTIDTCIEGQCQHAPDPVCAPVACDADTPCDSGEACTLGLCLSGTCVWFPNPYCP